MVLREKVSLPFFLFPLKVELCYVVLSGLYVACEWSTGLKRNAKATLQATFKSLNAFKAISEWRFKTDRDGKCQVESKRTGSTTKDQNSCIT